MDIEIRETHGKRPWVWCLKAYEKSEERVIYCASGWAKTRERAEQAARKASRLTLCHRCRKWAAGGGHRFCRACLCVLLDEPQNRTPIAPPVPTGTPYPQNHLKPWSPNGHQEE